MKFATVLAGFVIAVTSGSVANAAGTNALDRSKSSSLHEITITLPGGGVEHIRYVGNVAPEVVVTDGPTLSVSNKVSPFSWPDPGFAELSRISADMDRFWASFDKRMAGLMTADQNLIAAAMNDPNKPLETSFGKLPAGGYSYVSQFSLNGTCTQVMRINRRPGEAKPQVVTQTSGNCGNAQGRTTVEENAQGNSPIPISTRAFHRAGPGRQTL